MILVTLNIANFEYDIHSLVKAFFPKEEVTVRTEDKPLEETPLFSMEVNYELAETTRERLALESKISKEKNIPEPLASESEQEKFVAERNDTYGQLTLESEQGKFVAERNDTYGQLTLESEQEKFVAERNDTQEQLTLESAKIRKEDAIVIVIDGEEKSRISVNYEERTETKNKLKQALYQVLSEYTNTTLPWGTLTGIRPTKIPMSFLEEGRDEAWIRNYMKETYFASDEKIDLSIDIAKRELELLKKIDYEEGYSLYIGIPFCPSTCLYCSFTSYPLGKWAARMDEYLDALEKEIDFTAEVCKHKKLNTIYIGGGTPTTLTAEQLDRLLTKIEQTFDFKDLVEYTVEAGRPDSITREKLEALRKHNISRISINPQTMKQETLDLIGRHHTVEQTIESFYLARELGFDNINMDLIVGLPEESLEDVRNTMEQLKKLDPESITVHSLAIKRAARLRMFKEDYQNLKMNNTWEIIDLTARYAQEAGLQPYYLYRQKNMAGNFENVGYAKEGKAGIYNILIMEEKQTIIALGAGATTKFVFDEGKRIERIENVKDITNYLERIDEMIERKRISFERYQM